MNRFARRPNPRHRDVSRVAFAAALWLASLATHAADFSIGAGVGTGRGKTDCVAGYSCDHGSTFGKIFFGYSPSGNLEFRALAFGAGHFQGGDTSPHGTPFGGRFKVNGAGVTAGYRWGLAPDVSVLAQIGVASVRTRFDYATPFAGSASKTTAQPVVGLSLAYRIAPNWQLSLDYDETRFKVHTERGSLRMVGVAAQYSF